MVSKQPPKEEEEKKESIAQVITSALENEDFDDREFKRMRSQSFELLKHKFTEETAAIW